MQVDTARRAASPDSKPREHARKVRPDWPTARDREEDLAHHVALKRRIDRAALLYGAARLTADIDVTVRLGDRNAARLIRALEKSGFALRVRDVDDFVARTRVLPLLHRGSGMPIDMVLAGPGLEELFLKRRRRRTLDGVSVPVASPEDIVVMKVLAGRGKDEDDAVAILAAQRKLKLERIRQTLGVLERALDRSNPRPRFETLLRRARRRHGSA